jgi:transcriptional regulator with XRE-family HTH domain
MNDSASRFRDELRRLRAERGFSFEALADRVSYSRTYLEDLEMGRKPRGVRPPNDEVVERLDKAPAAGGRLVANLHSPTGDDVVAEMEALELTRRVAASDVSGETLDRPERAIDGMAMAYANTSPEL